MQFAASVLPPPASDPEPAPLLPSAPLGNPGDVGTGCTGLSRALATAELSGQGPHVPAALLLLEFPRGRPRGNDRKARLEHLGPFNQHPWDAR